MKYILSEEMEVPRMPSELYTWITNKIESIARQEGGTNSLRLLKNGCKELIEELFPLAIWASSQNDRERLIIEPKIGSQNYDAIVKHQSPTDPNVFYIEVTQAHPGETEYLRRLHLVNEGWSPGTFSKMVKEGTKKTGLTVKPGRVMTTSEESVLKTEKLIVEAVQKKFEKKYPFPTRLLVAFEDFIVSKHNDIESKLFFAIEQMVKEEVCTFPHIYLVGMSGKLMIEYEVKS